MDATVTFISVLTALAAVILSPLVSIYVVQRQVQAQIVSSNRQQWINRVRDELAQFIAGIRHVPSAYAADALSREEAISRCDNLFLHEETLRLLLNPNEHQHVELLGLIASARKDVIAAVNSKQGIGKQLDEHGDRIVVAAQSILKTEWIRVKNGE